MVGELSLASSAGLRKGTSAPAAVDTKAIFSSSVVTQMQSRILLSSARRIVHSIKGRPPNERIFFPGRPLLPPRAGMSPIAVLSLYIAYGLERIVRFTE